MVNSKTSGGRKRNSLLQEASQARSPKSPQEQNNQKRPGINKMPKKSKRFKGKPRRDDRRRKRKDDNETKVSKMLSKILRHKA